MMPVNLNVSAMLERAELFFPHKEVVSRTKEGMHRFTYKEIGARTRRLSSALQRLGVGVGDRVGTLAYNHHRHLEAYFGIPGLGAVIHTINPRLAPEHIIYTINHAGDKVLLVDEELLPLVEKIQSRLPSVQAYVVMSDSSSVPPSSLQPLYAYEGLLMEGDPRFPFYKDLDESAPAGLCYTFSAAGAPKGVLYSHRALVLHSFAVGLADTFGLSEADVCLPVVPMFHVNAWGLPYAATWFGAKQVLPGANFTPEVLAKLIEREKVTVTAGVPTIWMGLYPLLEKGDYDTSSLRAVVCGGSAAPPALIQRYEENLGIPFYHAYGLTETTPLVTVARLKSYQETLSGEEKLALKSKQGLLVPGLEMRIEGARGEVQWDGREMGELLLRGPWIAGSYFRDEESDHVFADGWFHTGDIATIDGEGFIQLVDRARDLIKSGGEWISPVELEQAIAEHEGVLEVAVVAVPSEVWAERPVACVVLRDEAKGKVTEEDILAFIRPRFPAWWLPDAVVFLEEIPKSPVGKFLKRKLKEQLRQRLQKPV